MKYPSLHLTLFLMAFAAGLAFGQGLPTVGVLHISTTAMTMGLLLMRILDPPPHKK